MLYGVLNIIPFSRCLVIVTIPNWYFCSRSDSPLQAVYLSYIFTNLPDPLLNHSLVPYCPTFSFTSFKLPIDWDTLRLVMVSWKAKKATYYSRLIGTILLLRYIIITHF